MSATTTVSVIGGVAFGRRSTSGLAVMCLAAALLLASTAGFAQVIVPAGEGAPDTGSPGASGSAHGSKYIVQFTPETPRSARAQVVQQAGAAVRHELDIINAIAVTVPNQNVLKGLMNNQSVRRVVPDHPLYEVAPKTPPAPVNLTATGFSSSQINLAWSEGVGNPEDGFRIERCTGTVTSCNDVDFGTLASVGANVVGYSDTGLPADETYAYRVIAFILTGKPSERDSAPSNEDDATTLPVGSPPNAPTGLVATDVSHDQINLTWSHVSPPDEDSFEIERC